MCQIKTNYPYKYNFIISNLFVYIQITPYISTNVTIYMYKCKV